MNPTPQQQAVTDAVLAGESVLVSACAGSGKTSTILNSIKQLPMETSVLYLVFNKANQLEMQEKIAGVQCSIDVRTPHSLAYKSHAFKVMLQRPKGAYKNVLGTAREVELSMKVPNFDNVTPRSIAAAIIATVNKFECSTHKVVQPYEQLVNTLLSKAKVTNRKVKTMVGNYVLEKAKLLWEMRKKKQALATHNTYLKLYSLSSPDLTKFDIIFVDEAQDTNGAVKAILDANISQQLIVTGDSRQTVYQFNHTVNLFDYYSSFVNLRLSKSFRFGDNLAKASQNWVNTFGANDELEGMPFETKIFVGITEFDTSVKHTVLFRRNNSMISAMLSYYASGVVVNVGASIIDGLIKSVVELGLLFEGRIKEIKNPELLLFPDWESYVIDDNANDWLVSVIEAGGTRDLLDRLTVIKDKQGDSHVDFLTVHRSKGLEFDVVILWDDVLDIGRKDNESEEDAIRRAPASTINIGYVAITRAIKELWIAGGDSDYVMSCV